MSHKCDSTSIKCAFTPSKRPAKRSDPFESPQGILHSVVSHCRRKETVRSRWGSKFYLLPQTLHVKLMRLITSCSPSARWCGAHEIALISKHLEVNPWHVRWTRFDEAKWCIMNGLNKMRKKKCKWVLWGHWILHPIWKMNTIEGIAGTSWLFNTSVIQIRWCWVLHSMWLDDSLCLIGGGPWQGDALFWASLALKRLTFSGILSLWLQFYTL